MHSDILPRCGAISLPDGTIGWRLWAPKARQVELVLIHGEQRRTVAMLAEEGGYFVHTEADVADAQPYAYRLDGGPERPDPASLWQPEGVHRHSAVARLERFGWSDQAWPGVARKDLVFYELHVGTFTPEGTFEAIIPRLEALCDLGITAIELMPVAQFPGSRNWGYDGVHLYAPQNSYGGPRGLQRLVDACHAAGLAIFMDVVYNHLGPEGNYLQEFGPYFSDRYNTPWGLALNYDNAGCDPVREFILNNVRLWLEDYHMDGLRLDAVSSIYDVGPKHLLQAIKETADEIADRQSRPIHIVAESNLNNVRLLRSAEAGGYGHDAQWQDDFHHVVHGWLTGEKQGYYMDFGQLSDFPKLFEKTFVFDGSYNRYLDRRHGAPVGDLPGDRFVIAIQNHDQVGNRARGDRLSTLVSPSAQRLAASLMLLAPHLPLLFMGEEYGEQRPFLFFCSFADTALIHNVREGRKKEFADFAWQGEVPDPQDEATFLASRLSWSWPAGTPQAALRKLYRDLLHARRVWPALKDYRHRKARLLAENENGVLLVSRGNPAEPEQTLQMYFNLTDRAQPMITKTNFPSSSLCQLLFSSEAARYGGSRSDNEWPIQLLPYECVVRRG